MRFAVWLLVAVGCDGGARRKTEEIKPIPVGPYVVHYDCFHSDEPFGKGSQYRNTTYDLGAATLASQSYELSGEVGPTAPPPPPQPTITPLAPSRVVRIEAAVKAVLRGGPYKPELPGPEGTPCTLKIEADGREVFTLEKAATEQPDLTTDLVRAL